MAQMIKDLLERWIQPHGKTITEVLDLFASEQFLTDLGEETEKWVWQHQPQTMEEALRLAESFMVAEEDVRRGKLTKVMTTLRV